MSISCPLSLSFQNFSFSLFLRDQDKDVASSSLPSFSALFRPFLRKKPKLVSPSTSSKSPSLPPLLPVRLLHIFFPLDARGRFGSLLFTLSFFLLFAPLLAKSSAGYSSRAID